MTVKDYLNIILNESEDDNINFDKDFWNAGRFVENGITEDDVDSKELEMGIEVEMEHTLDKKIARKIALDHLAEFKDYYTRLKKMEDEAKLEMKNESCIE